MDKEVPNPNRCKINPINPTAIVVSSFQGEVCVDRQEEGEENEKESNSLLSPGADGVSPSKKMKKNPSRRKVQWNDRNGHKLVEILEFQPSDSSDSEDDEDSDSCMCTIM